MTKGIIYILINDSTVQSLVGNKTTIPAEFKVYPLYVPQDEVDQFIVCRMLSNPSVPCKGRSSSTFIPVVQVACYHKSYEACLALESAVIEALDNKEAGDYNGINFSYLRYIDSSEDWINKDGIPLYVRLPQFEAQTNESPST